MLGELFVNVLNKKISFFELNLAFLNFEADSDLLAIDLHVVELLPSKFCFFLGPEGDESEALRFLRDVVEYDLCLQRFVAVALEEHE